LTNQSRDLEIEITAAHTSRQFCPCSRFVGWFIKRSTRKCRTEPRKHSKHRDQPLFQRNSPIHHRHCFFVVEAVEAHRPSVEVGSPAVEEDSTAPAVAGSPGEDLGKPAEGTEDRLCSSRLMPLCRLWNVRYVKNGGWDGEREV
jgi:hypothetical protein